MSDDAAAKAAELAELDRQIAIRRASLETGVPPELLTKATTEAEARAIAEQAIAWRGNPQTEQVPSEPFYPVMQYRRDDLAHLTADEVAQAYRDGRLAQIGAPAPQPHSGRP